LVQRSEAQVLFGSVSGTVTDQSGATVSKAHISSVNRATGVQKETDADAGGHYTLTDLSPGAYDVTVTATGFKPLTQTDVRVGANVVTNTNFNLQIGSVSEKVTVEAAAVTLQTEKTDVHTEIPAKAIQEMPLNQYRVIRDLMRTVDRDNVIITHDSGSPREQLLPFWETTAPGSYMGWGKSTQLGYGLGIIMGAKLAAPDKLCVNVMGDAAIGMTGMDIETAARNRIAILTVVFNNGVMAAERDVLELSTRKYGALTVGGNYAKVAEGLNVAATRVETPADIVPAIKDAVAVTQSGAPFLLEIVAKQGYDFSRYPLAGL